MNEVSGEPHEPSYYEIALTNRQVMVAFIILLLCVLGAFFSGVWVGRGGSNPRQAQTAQGAPSTASAQPMQELQFFSGKPAAPKPGESPAGSLAADLQRKPEPATNAPAAASDVPPAAPVPATASAAPATVSESAPTPPPTSTAVAPALGVGEPTRSASTASAPTKPAAANTGKPSTPVAAAVPPAATASSAGTTAAAAPNTTAKPTPAKTSELAPGEMVVQVFSSSDGEQAKKMLARVNKGGFKAYLSPLQVGTQTMYRVRIGPFTDRAQAQKVADQVRKKFRLDTWITR